MQARGLDRSTLVLVTSDHGEEFLDHGAWGHERTLYEELVRVPMIVHGLSRRRNLRPMVAESWLNRLVQSAWLITPAHSLLEEALGN